jgi:hypothetical protein
MPPSVCLVVSLFPIYTVTHPVQNYKLTLLFREHFSARYVRVWNLLCCNIFGILYCHNPSGLTMILGSTQPLTRMSTGDIFFWVKAVRCVGFTTLPHSCADCLGIWNPQPPETLGSVQVSTEFLQSHTADLVFRAHRLLTGVQWAFFKCWGELLQVYLL